LPDANAFGGCCGTFHRQIEATSKVRFSCDKKCANCAIDFPDVNNGWVPASGSMTDVVKTLDRMYPHAKEVQSWFGHPLRKAHAAISTRKPETQPDQPSPV